MSWQLRLAVGRRAVGGGRRAAGGGRWVAWTGQSPGRGRSARSAQACPSVRLGLFRPAGDSCRSRSLLTLTESERRVTGRSRSGYRWRRSRPGCPDAGRIVRTDEIGRRKCDLLTSRRAAAAVQGCVTSVCSLTAAVPGTPWSYRARQHGGTAVQHAAAGLG